MTFTGFLGGLLIIAGGISLVLKTEWYLGMFGRVPWADEHLGFEGGTRLFYKLLGVIICFFGILTAFGLFHGFFASTAGQLLAPQGQNQ